MTTGYLFGTGKDMRTIEGYLEKRFEQLIGEPLEDGEAESFYFISGRNAGRECVERMPKELGREKISDGDLRIGCESFLEGRSFYKTGEAYGDWEDFIDVSEKDLEEKLNDVVSSKDAVALRNNGFILEIGRTYSDVAGQPYPWGKK